MYRAIRDLPGIDLEGAVGQAWERAKREGVWQTVSMAEAAIEFGHVDALERAVNGLDYGPSAAGYMRNARQVVLRHIDFYGTNGEIRRWFHANKDRLTFDPETRKFRVRG